MLAMVAIGCYVAVSAALAVTGAIIQKPQPLLLDIAWTLPCGLGAFVSIYFGYAAMVGAANVMGLATETSTGLEPSWFGVGDGVITTVAFTGAAVANVLILRDRRKARRLRAAMPHPG